MKILILGAGALGSNIAKLLAIDVREAHEITVLDFDIVEERNYRANTQFFFREQRNLPKVEVLQYNIYKHYGRKIGIINNRLTKLNYNDVLNYDLLIDCFDNHDSRALVDFISKEYEDALEVLHIGFSNQFTFAIEWAKNYQVPEDDVSGFDVCEAQGAASFISMVSSLSSLVIQDFLSSGTQREFMGSRFSITELK